MQGTPDFGYAAPVRTVKECANPEFMNRHLHRVGLMKREHLGSPGDSDPSGAPGWIVRGVCVGCSRVFNKVGGFFIDEHTTAPAPGGEGGGK